MFFCWNLFAGLGLTGIVPVILGWSLYSGIMAVHRALSLDVPMGIIYLVGSMPAHGMNASACGAWADWHCACH